MKVYKSYEEAKINHANEVIWTDLNKNFGCASAFKNSGYIVFKAEPEEYCMTVDEFLRGGYKLKAGDLVLGFSGCGVLTMNGDEDDNELDANDKNRYILRAAALEKPKRTRTEYEKVTESIFDLRDEFERGELHWWYESDCKDKSEFVEIRSEYDLSTYFAKGNIFKRVKKEIDWRDESHGYLANKTGFYWSAPIAEVISDESDCFLELCRVALRANGEIE